MVVACTLPLDKVADPDSDAVETVRDVLSQKQAPSLSALIEPNTLPPEPHPFMIAAIDGQLIRNTVLKMDGAAGPSGLDAAAWKHICTSFKTASAGLCESLPIHAARWLCSEYVDPSAYLSTCLKQKVGQNP